MFTQKCFIRKNNTRLILKLDSIGYKTNPLVSTEQFFDKKLFLVTDVNGYFLPVKPQSVLPDCFDCGKNEDLFFAISALRDDTTKHQWFIDAFGKWHYGLPITDGILRKATVEELIEHFKKK